MQTKTYNVYKFHELTKEQQQKAIDNLRDTNVDYDGWHEFTIEDETARLNLLGYEDVKISYSGFWSQGNGASFTAGGNIEKLVPANMQKYVDRIAFKKSGHYEHEYTMSLDIDYNDEPLGNTQIIEFENLEKELLENARIEARAIYSRLQNEYEYYTSDESIIATIESNDYDFTENGKID